MKYIKLITILLINALFNLNSMRGEMIAVGGGRLPDDSVFSTKDKYSGKTFGKYVKGIQIGKYEVTWKEWNEVRDWGILNGYNDINIGAGISPDHPVTDVNGYDALKWCNAKSEKEGLKPVYNLYGSQDIYRIGEELPKVDIEADGYRLPNEAEWEWVGIGGKLRFGFTLKSGYSYSGGSYIDYVAWHYGNSVSINNNLEYGGRTASPVGLKGGNELGVYDMSGNVWEWCYNGENFPLFDKYIEMHGLNFNRFNCRGGAFFNNGYACVISFRDDFYNPGESKNSGIGFRIARNTNIIPSIDYNDDFSAISDTCIGNFLATGMINAWEGKLYNGQLCISIKKSGSYSGYVFYDGNKIPFKGSLERNGKTQVTIKQTYKWSNDLTNVDISKPVLVNRPTSIEDLANTGGYLFRIYLEAVTSNHGRVVYANSVLGDVGSVKKTISFSCFPVAHPRNNGNVSALEGRKLNGIFYTSEERFGYSFVSAKIGKDGKVTISGRMADGTALSGSSWLIQDSDGNLRIPLAITLSDGNGILHGDALVLPYEGKLGFFSHSSFVWARPPINKINANEILQELELIGSEWIPKKGSALSGSSSNFILSLSSPINNNGFDLDSNAKFLRGILPANNKPIWESKSTPKGFNIKFDPSTGFISGKIPVAGSSKSLPFYGILFDESFNVLDKTLRGAGFVAGGDSSGILELNAP